LLATGFDDHPADARIGWQAGELAADWRKLAVVVNRAELEERFVAVANGFGLRRIEERKLIDRSQIEGEELQDDRGEVRPLDFGRGEPLAREIVVFAKQANADARPNAAAAPLRWSAEACEMDSMGSRCSLVLAE